LDLVNLPALICFSSLCKPLLRLCWSLAARLLEKATISLVFSDLLIQMVCLLANSCSKICFFILSGSLFIETNTDAKIRSSAQGLFMMMTNGFGAISGSFISGLIIDSYFTVNNTKNWHGIWLCFAAYSLVVAVLFAIFFKHKHDPKAIKL